LRVGALVQKEVGDYLNKYFVSSYQKISNFVVTSNGAKQGGNVASYFCMPDGRVLHVVVGPVSGTRLLDEARWVEETWKLAEMLEVKDFLSLQVLFRKAHLDRLSKEYAVAVNMNQLPPLESPNATAPIKGAYVKYLLNRSGNQQVQAQLLVAAFPGAKIGRLYETVFESILHQSISTTPVVKNH